MKTRYFIGEPEIKKIGGSKAILLQDFTYVDRLGRHHTAKKGFETNGISGPKIALALLGCSPFGQGFNAAIIHDWYWARANDLPTRKERLALRKTADKLFVEMLKTVGLGIIRRRIMYRCVRMASTFRK